MTVSGLYDGATTAELDRLSIQTAAEMIGEEQELSNFFERRVSAYQIGVAGAVCFTEDF